MASLEHVDGKKRSWRLWHLTCHPSALSLSTYSVNISTLRLLFSPGNPFELFCYSSPHRLSSLRYAMDSHEFIYLSPQHKAQKTLKCPGKKEPLLLGLIRKRGRNAGIWTLISCFDLFFSSSFSLFLFLLLFIEDLVHARLALYVSKNDLELPTLLPPFSYSAMLDLCCTRD